MTPHEEEVFHLNKRIEFLQTELTRVSRGYQADLRKDVERDSIFAKDLRDAKQEISELKDQIDNLENEISSFYQS